VNESLKVDIVQGEALPGDLYLLASDGLTRLVNDEELAAILTSRGIDAADMLIETSLSRGAPDNVTLVVVKVV
jgi:serine/threonine protein phosphatase PrpC